MPEPSFQTVQSLGSEAKTLRPRTSNILAGTIISVLMIVCGLALSWWVDRQAFHPGLNPPRDLSHKIAAIAMIGFGFLLATCGFFVAWGMRRLASFALTICKHGFYFSRRGVVSVFGYADILHVEETVVHEQVPIARSVTEKALPKVTSCCYEIYRCDGERFYFDESNLPRTSLLSGPLSKAKLAHGFAWNRNEITR